MEFTEATPLVHHPPGLMPVPPPAASTVRRSSLYFEAKERAKAKIRRSISARLEKDILGSCLAQFFHPPGKVLQTPHSHPGMSLKFPERSSFKGTDHIWIRRIRKDDIASIR
jgi:hypothetical protein